MRLLLCILSLFLAVLVGASENQKDTNSQRLRRGLPLRQPKRLWTPTRSVPVKRNAEYDHTPSKRQLPAATTYPATGPITTVDIIAGRRYRFTGEGGSGTAAVGNSALNHGLSHGATTVVEMTPNLNATCTLVVGAQSPLSTTPAGGGGGTFFYSTTSTLTGGNGAIVSSRELIMPVGGGGGGSYNKVQGFDAIADISMAGTGQGGLAGGIITEGGAGGGAGWLSDGQSTRAIYGPASGAGGSSAPTWAGSAGSSYQGPTSLDGRGGFGGGGGGVQFGGQGAGGGGGYTGGDGNGPSNTGYGGTTFVSGSFQGATITLVSSQVATTTGDGFFTVEVLE